MNLRCLTGGNYSKLAVCDQFGLPQPVVDIFWFILIAAPIVLAYVIIKRRLKKNKGKKS